MNSFLMVWSYTIKLSDWWKNKLLLSYSAKKLLMVEIWRTCQIRPQTWYKAKIRCPTNHDPTWTTTPRLLTAWVPGEDAADVRGQILSSPALKGGRGIGRTVNKELYPPPVRRPRQRRLWREKNTTVIQN